MDLDYLQSMEKTMTIYIVLIQAQISTNQNPVAWGLIIATIILGIFLYLRRQAKRRHE